MDAAENAGGGDRTHTILRSLDFESRAFATQKIAVVGNGFDAKLLEPHEFPDRFPRPSVTV